LISPFPAPSPPPHKPSPIRAATSSGLQLASKQTTLTGQDAPGQFLPVAIVGQAATGTWNRLLRLQNSANQFFDIGVDSGGSLFINSPNSSATSHVLTISPSGTVTIGNLVLNDLAVAPGGSVDLAVNNQGQVFKQG
jgi:hypothetical protein